MRWSLAVWLTLSIMLVSGCTGRPPEDATGEEIYVQLCSNCHGSDLAGGLTGPAIGAGTNSAEQSDEYLETTILNGRGRMPSFLTTLDDVQLERLISFLRAEQSR